MRAYLQLENGTTFSGTAFGKVEDIVGEIILNNSMIGYEEVITDPTNKNKIVIMTYPQIGNYGFNLEDMEGEIPSIAALICRSRSKYPNNFRCEMNMDAFFNHFGLMGIEGIDTRALTRIIREEGSQRAVISAKRMTHTALQETINSYDTQNIIEEVTTKETYDIEGKGAKLAVWDFGIKKSLLNYFVERGLNIRVFPSMVSYEKILEFKPDGILLSNGPGIPMQYLDIINDVKELIGEAPILGVGKGAEFLAMAMGGKLRKLGFGHRGTGYPIKDIDYDRVYLSTQNHGFVLENIPEDTKITFRNMNDNTIEGFISKDEKSEGIFFHPEGHPGPKDTQYILYRFVKRLEDEKNA